MAGIAVRHAAAAVFITALLATGCAGSPDPGGGSATDAGGGSATDAGGGSATDAPVPPEATTAPAAAPEAPAAADEVVACDLLTADEISAAVGTPVEQGDTFAAPACVWIGDSGAAVNLVIRSVGDAEACRRSRVGETSDVAGLGDEAWWEFTEASSANVGAVTICLGSDQLGLTAAGPFEEGPLRDGMVELAETAVDRL